MIQDPMATALAGMASNHRVPMAREILSSFVNASAQNIRGDLKAKFAQHQGDPAMFPTNTRKPVMTTGRSGARYAIRVNAIPPEQTEIGPTQANGRIIRNRGGAGGSFWAGAGS